MAYRWARRVLRLVVVLFLVTLAVTFLIDLAPGDPAYVVLGEQASPERVAILHTQLHLDDPFHIRYWHWLTAVLRGDLSTSLLSQQSVIGAIGERLPVTLELVVLALVIALVLAVPIAVYTAYRAGSVTDRLWSVGSATLISLPPFVTGLLFVYLLALRPDAVVHFPASGWTRLSEGIGANLWHASLPALTLACAEIPAYSRLLRADLIATLREDYILAAKAKGLSATRILFRHAIRPSSFSLITLAGLSMGRLIGGAVIVETLFALPGLGQLLVLAVHAKDVVVVQGVVAFVAVAYVLLNTLVDGVYEVLDPRVRAAPAA
jgi:peptide/nickel transport system permease protein